MSSILVLGAGPAGAASAIFLARRGHSVTVLEKDPLPASNIDIESWNRKSTPHAQQGHSFLARCTSILEVEAPDLVDKLISAGAHRVNLRYSASHWNLLARRRLFDAALFNALIEEPNVTLLPNTVATGLIMKENSNQVTGLTTNDNKIHADLVIDAGGRYSPIPRWLTEKGINLNIQNDPTQFFYLTRHYKLRAGNNFPNTRVPIVVTLEYATILAFPEDNEYFQLTIQLYCKDPTKKALRNAEIFNDFLTQVPRIKPWIIAGEPIGPPKAYSSVGNKLTRTFDGTALVTGILMVGDAAIHTNPTAGRGVTLAMMHSQALANLVDDTNDKNQKLDFLSMNWDQLTLDLIGPWLISQMEIDRERLEQCRSVIEGKPSQTHSDVTSRIAFALSAFHDCKIIGSAGDKLLNMLATQAEIFADRKLMHTIFQRTRRESPSLRELGPTYEEYLHFTKEYCYVRN